MLPEQPHHAPGTGKEFLKQYAMIVLSILTALGLERVAVELHDRSAARASRVQIEAELAGNAADLAESERVNRASIKQTRTALKALVAQLKVSQSGSDKTVAPPKPPALSLTGFSFSTPSWQRQAWESALSDQSANHLNPVDLNRYRSIYGAEKEFEDLVQLLAGGDWVTQATDLELDVQLGRFDTRQAAGVLARYLLIVEQVEAGEDRLSSVLAGKPVAPATASLTR